MCQCYLHNCIICKCNGVFVTSIGLFICIVCYSLVACLRFLEGVIYLDPQISKKIIAATCGVNFDSAYC